MQLPKILIIELGSQYTLLIERTLRELGYRSVVLNPERAAKWIGKNPLNAVILSGGAASVYDKDAPKPPEGILSLSAETGTAVPILGICFGMQWLVKRFGGTVGSVEGKREYGEAVIRLARSPGKLFSRMPRDQRVWMSHGDSVTSLPEGFGVLASSSTGAIAAMGNGSVWGVQFHPEVTHTRYGRTVLRNFMEIAGCEKDWVPLSMIDSIQNEVLGELGDRTAVIGFSGGVDSTTLAAILSPVLGDRLRPVAIDGGNLREGEVDEIMAHAAAAGVALSIVDAKEAFRRALDGVTDAEEKRARFRKVYADILVSEAKRMGAQAVLQGTLAPDRIETGATGGAPIKTHHNVGLDMGGLLQVHPLGDLFKYEVRALAKAVDLPKSVWNRQPFPGPGLFIRVVGTPATPEKLAIVRWADARVREVLERAGVYDTLAQLVVAYVGVNTVGVKGDGRVYRGAIVVRAVETADFMTVRGVHLSDAVEDEICSVLTGHPDIVRVWFDPTKKPPATTEME